jgi:hypothetical protein
VEVRGTQECALLPLRMVGRCLRNVNARPAGSPSLPVRDRQ